MHEFCKHNASTTNLYMKIKKSYKGYIRIEGLDFKISWVWISNETNIEPIWNLLGYY